MSVEINFIARLFPPGYLKGLFIILYCNLSEVIVDGKEIKSEAVLSLTSAKLKGAIDSSSTKEEISAFIQENKISASQETLIETVIAEARKNNFVVRIQFSK